MARQLTKCDFCKYRTNGGCMVTPNSYYCKEAQNEFYIYLNKLKQRSAPPRPWERKK